MFKKLVVEVGKKYTRSTLFRMKQFYSVFNEEKVAPLVRQLSWSQCLILLPIKDINKINYYIEQISKRNLSKRGLQEIIKNKEYERLPEDTKRKLMSKEENKTIGIIICKKDNKYVIEYSSDERILSRKYTLV